MVFTNRLRDHAQTVGRYLTLVRRKIGIRRRIKVLAFTAVNNMFRVWIGMTERGSRLTPLSKDSVKRLLICNGAHLGDIVTVLSVIPAVRANYPDAEIGLVIGSWTLPLVEGHPDIAHIHIVDAWMRHNRAPIAKWRKLRRYLATRWRALRDIRAVGYDCAVDTYFYGEHSQVLMWQAGIPVRVAYDRRGFPALLTHPVPWRDQDRHIADYHLELLRKLPGSWPRAMTQYVLPAPPKEAAATVATTLDDPAVARGSYIVIHPGTGAVTREWPRTSWAQLMTTLESTDVRLVLTGVGARECDTANWLAHEVPSAINLAGQLSFSEFRALLAGAKAVVGVESLAVHLAAAAGVPTVAIWSGITRPAQWAPLGDNVHLVRSPLDCAPCLRPNGCSSMACLNGLAVPTVAAAVQTAIEAVHSSYKSGQITNRSARTPIFIHSLFRAGSTYIFHAFRRADSGEFWCYQEPLHEELPRLAIAGALRVKGEDDRAIEALRHPRLARSHNYEYHVAQSDLPRLFRKSFPYDDFFLPARGTSNALLEYLAALERAARGRAVFQMCRSIGRVEFLKQNMGGIHILLLRNPRDQWWSYQIAPYFDVTSLLIANARNIPGFIWETALSMGFCDNHKSQLEKEMRHFGQISLPVAMRYELFFSLWCYQILESQQHTDLVMDMDLLTADAGYRKLCENRLQALGIVGVTLKDCSMPRRTLTKTEHALFADAEARVLCRAQNAGYTASDIAAVTDMLPHIHGAQAHDADLALANERFSLLTQRDKAIAEAQTLLASKVWRATLPLRAVMQAAKEITQWNAKRVLLKKQPTSRSTNLRSEAAPTEQHRS